jgi:hypothetical protein
VAAGDDPAVLPKALARIRPLAFRGGRQPSLGQVRLALSGTCLAVAAEVRDPQPRRDSLLSGSVEVFGAMPGSRRIWSVTLQPAVGDALARAVVEADGSLAPAADVRVASATLPAGYRVAALVPLERLGLDVSRSQVLIEMRANAMRDGAAVQQTTMGNRAPHADYGPYPRFRPEMPGDSAP